MARCGMACDTRHFVGDSLEMVQIGIAETGRFYEVAADHSKERPAASMMPSMTRRNTLGSSRCTKRLAMKAPNIKDEPAIRPFSAISGVRAPNCWKVTDLERYTPSELAASVARN